MSPAPSPEKAKRSESCRILIADDDVSLCVSLSDILEVKGHVSDSVHSGTAALAACEKVRYDVVLLDISLPDISGLDLITQLEERHQDIDILVITGHASMDSAVQAVSRSTIGYLIKPIDLDRLLAILDRIGERKRVGKENVGLIAELERKNAELESYAYTVSHDLKSPLITISGFLQLVGKSARAGDFEQMEADIDRIEVAAHRMRDLLDQLLELSRAGRLIAVSQDVALSELARKASEMVAGDQKLAAVRIEIADSLPRVHCDRVRLLEVFQNLIENAIKFMGPQAHPRIEIGSRTEENRKVVFVSDNGIGLASTDTEKIFGLFDKLDGKSGGTGLGLALVKRIVEVHGGRIWVESEGLGRGSTFCFTLPGPG